MKDDRKREAARRPSRRQFLGQASCAAVGSTALFNTVLNMGMFNTLAGGAPGYRGLVCLFLGGGIDSYNVLVPRGVSEHAEYAGVRADLALPRDLLLPITPTTPDGKEYGLHPALGALQSLFEQGSLALVANVGTLVEPTTLQQFQNGGVALPLGLFSHSDQAMHWQTSIPDRRTAVGWAGRIADILQAGNGNQNISMNISLSGSNIWQSGNVTSHYTIGPDGSQGLAQYDQAAAAGSQQVFTQAVDGLLGLHYQHVFEKAFAARMRGAIDAHLEFSAAIEALPPLTTQFSANGLSQRFRMIAQTIQARELLGMSKQTFFVEASGWDHHDEVLANQEAMLPIVAGALAEFQSALSEIGVADQVTTFTASDFARTLSSNGRGSDHAWGGNHLVMGGAVTGGDIYGTFPSLFPGNPLDTNRGRLIPTTSCDEYFAELALWFGVPAADLELVLPNISHFYSPGSSQPPVGFLGAAGAGTSGATPGAGRLGTPAPSPARPAARRRA